MKKNFKLIIIFAGIILIVVLVITLIFSHNKHTDSYATDKEAKELSIEQYLLNKGKDAYFRSSDSKFFCAVEILWEYDLTKTEKIVYAPNNCVSVLLINGDLRGESGGDNPPLFKMEYKNNAWIVVDADNRLISPKEPITQDWVKDAESKIPDNIKNRCFANNCFSTDGVIKKAAEFFKVKLPEYT